MSIVHSSEFIHLYTVTTDCDVRVDLGYQGCMHVLFKYTLQGN